MPALVNCTHFAAACECGLWPSLHSWAYPAPCDALVKHIGPLMVEDTHFAMKAWANYRGRTLPVLHPNDVVVHSRCAGDTWLEHPTYGPVAFSFYDNMPADAKNIVIITELYTAANHKGCNAKLQALMARLQARNPNARVYTADFDLFDAYAALTVAKTIYREYSTLSYWAALANGNSPTVYYPAGEEDHLDGLDGWVARDSLVLKSRQDCPPYCPKPNPPLTSSNEDVPRVIQWLETH